MKTTTFALIFCGIFLAFSMTAQAEGPGTSGGLSLLGEGSAVPAALGGAYTASFDDIAGMTYNPASLTTLKRYQASLMYQQGLIQDNYGQFMLGGSRGKTGLGLSVGYYNAGTITLIDSSGNTSDVNAQRDITVGLGIAQKFGNLSSGLTLKYLNSTLIDRVSASAYAVDAGLQMPIFSRLRIGVAALNYGSELKYIEEGDSLPRMLRAGASYLLFPGRASTTLLLDAPYMVNEKLLTPSAGLQTLVGPMALRVGYKSGGETNEFTAGAGFALGSTSLDYAFGLINQLESQHKVSLAMKFGGMGTNNDFVKRTQPTEREIAEVTETGYGSTTGKSAVTASKTTVPAERMHTLGGQTVLRAPIRQQQRRVYVVRPGDTLGRIAQKTLGDKRQWKAIYTANKHLIDDPSQVEVGTRIIIP